MTNTNQTQVEREKIQRQIAYIREKKAYVRGKENTLDYLEAVYAQKGNVACLDFHNDCAFQYQQIANWYCQINAFGPAVRAIKRGLFHAKQAEERYGWTSQFEEKLTDINRQRTSAIGRYLGQREARNQIKQEDVMKGGQK